MFNAMIIVWRESLEAMLVIGVLLAWIARQPERLTLRRGLWAGAGAGLALAAMLGVATFVASGEMAGITLESFQLAMMFFAAILIASTVLWMHRHGRELRRDLETAAGRRSGAWGIGTIAALAVAREGAETVVFLYGLIIEAGSVELAGLLIAALAGFAVAGVTCWIVARGSRFLSYRMVFRVSLVALLLIANAMLAGGIDRLLATGWVSPLLDPAWDSSALLDDGAGFGRALADFAGYRARPTGLLVAVSVAFWIVIAWRLFRSRDRRGVPAS